MFLKNLTTNRKLTLGAAAVLLGLSGCHPVIYDDLPACVPEYRVRLSYNRNMDFAERVNEVDAAEVYAFDSEGALREIGLANRAQLEEGDWTIHMKELKRHQPYKIVVWGGITEDSPFSISGNANRSAGDFNCSLATETDADGNRVSQQRLAPLFHGTDNHTFTEEEGYEEKRIDLTKDTNTVSIILRKDDGTPITSSEFEIKIIDSNGVITFDNDIDSDDDIHYKAVSVTPGEYEKPDGSGGTTGETSKGALAEISISRLVEDSGARIVIIDRETGQVMVDMPLIDLISDMKGNVVPDMEMQEYLDREDSFNVDITFHVDAFYIHLGIFVNGWSIVNYDVEWK
ncbi:MAG: FimB/Mfa2 family fimbrial subunit [Muribaculaceae bacterium]|nr:FimB/Mfa2 family fimbrial subunit [Muribaculaceae bacterium]